MSIRQYFSERKKENEAWTARKEAFLESFNKMLDAGELPIKAVKSALKRAPKPDAPQ